LANGKTNTSGNVEYWQDGLRYRHFEGFGPQNDTRANVAMLDGHAESIQYGTLTFDNVDGVFHH
jgi:prepilin-type processing-associated H-X9-DG protein